MLSRPDSERAGKLADAPVELPRYDTLIERDCAPVPRFPLAERMFVERGDKSDWEALHDLHYKAENLPPGPKIWRLRLEGETIGVCVTSVPKGLLKERHVAFPKIKPAGGDTTLINTQRYNFINQNFRVISRCVVDTMYRGIGAGSALCNLATRLEGARFMEIQSSMSKFNYFAQKAGFKFVKPMNANKYQAGLTFFRETFEALPQDYEAIIAEIEAMPARLRELTETSVREFYYRHSAQEKTGSNRNKGTGKVDAMPIGQVIKSLQQIVLASPMYGVYVNPDHQKPVPERLALSAFWRQQPQERLAA